MQSSITWRLLTRLFISNHLLARGRVPKIHVSLMIAVTNGRNECFT